MAHSVNTYTGDGSTTQFAISFTLGFISRDHVQCRVADEVDGLGDPVYRSLTWINDGLVEVQGDVPGVGESVVFTRTVPKDELIHDYSDGAPIEEENLDESNLQNLMAIHEFLDGRLATLSEDLDMGNNKIINLADGVDDNDAANMSQINAVIGDAQDWATKTDGIVDATDYSSKAYAIGGTGVTNTAGRGAAKEWATKAEDSTVDGTEYSAKHYAAKAAASASSAAADATATAADVVQTNADVVTTGNNVTAAQTAQAGAETARALAEDYANEEEDVEVEPGLYSAKHWSLKALANSAAQASNVSYDNATSGLTATNVQDALDELDAYNDTHGDIVTSNVADFATAAQGATADTAVQPGDMLDVSAAGAFGGQLLHVQDQKASGTAGGTFTSGAWQTRTLNTVLTNEIADASLVANQITLPAGTYYIEAGAPAKFVDGHKAKLRNITDGADVIIGTSEYADNTSAVVTTHSFVTGRFTIGAQKTFELQHICAVTSSGDGFGVANSFGVVEVYADVKIWKVG